MKIAFYNESGQIPEIGTGHKFRAKILSAELQKRGHEVVGAAESDLIVIDHMFSQKDIIKSFRNKKIVLIDGAEEDAGLVDLSISSNLNAKAKYKGIDYVVVSPLNGMPRYKARANNRHILISMGGFDYNNYAEKVINTLENFDGNFLITKSINHDEIKRRNVETFRQEDYYNAMKTCSIAITNGGLTMFQCMYYGIPTIPISQYNHQCKNIQFVKSCCAYIGLEGLLQKVRALVGNKDKLEKISNKSKQLINGEGCNKICNLIEGL